MERAIDASTELGVSFDRARSVLLADAAGTVEPVAFPGMVIEVDSPILDRGDSPADDGSTLASGSTRAPGSTGRDSVLVPLWWRATGFERLFPVFEGALELVAVTDDVDGQPVARLQLRGRYVVPLGAMGRFGDGVVGRRVARRTAASLIEAIAERIGERAGQPEARGEAPEARPALTMVRDRESDPWPTKVP